jgi:hypothetical protein
MDLPILSVLKQRLHRDGEKLTFIKQEVSDTSHNQRTRNFVKVLQFGSIAQPSIDTKMEKMPLYTWSKSQQEL